MIKNFEQLQVIYCNTQAEITKFINTINSHYFNDYNDRHIYDIWRAYTCQICGYNLLNIMWSIHPPYFSSKWDNKTCEEMQIKRILE